MSAPDCPEDLLVRARTGAPPLLSAERLVLDGHVATCAVCRMSRALLDAVGPLPPPSAADRALAARVLAAWSDNSGVAPAPPRERRRPRAERSRWAAAALLLITAGASAAMYRALPSLRAASRAAPSPQVSLPRARPEPRRSEPRLDPVPPPEAPPDPTVERTVPAPRPAAASRAPSAPLLFQRANRARADGDLPAAKALYRELQARYPSTPEAHLSFFSLGEMLLGGGDPHAALGQFREYLRAGDDTLAEDALVRAARACQQLGQTEEEVTFWRRLQADFPRSDYRWLAEDRLRALRAGAP